MEPSLLTNLFHVGPDAQTTVSILEKIVRPVLVYVFLVVGLRLAGRRELAQLNAFDLVVLLTISNTVQNAIIGSDNSLAGGLIGATTLLVFNYIVVRFVFGHPRIERLLEGDPTYLVQRGRLVEDRLRAEGITRAELESAARRQGFASLGEVDRAILEATGSITFSARKPRVHEARHQDVMRRLDELAVDLRAIRARLDGRNGSPSVSSDHSS
jgi:uncharacterized membrane protein YcaP (DUF421 family)